MMSRPNAWLSWFVYLLVTWLLGFGTGFSLHYAMNRSGAPEGPTAARPEETPDINPGQVASGGPTQTGEVARAPAPQERPSAPPTPPGPEQPVAQEEKWDSPGNVWPARHLFIAVEGPRLTQAAKDLLRALRPGGVVLRDVNLANTAQTLALVREIKAAVGLGQGFTDLPLIAADHEGGRVNLFQMAEAPSAAELGRSQDTEWARQIGRAYAARSVDLGVNVLFAPVLDVYEPTTVYPSLITRAFAEDQYVVAAMGLALADGIMQGGVIPVAKHFPGYGAATYGADGFPVVEDRVNAGLGNTMYPFNEAVNCNIPGIMVGHVTVPGLDPDRPASLSPILVGKVMRELWGFQGVVLASDMASNALIQSRSVERSVVEALAAGCDAILFLESDPETIRAVCDAIESAVRTGGLSLANLEESKKRLDRWRSWLERPTGLEPPLPQLTPRTIVARRREPQSSPSSLGPVRPLPTARETAPSITTPEPTPASSVVITPVQQAPPAETAPTPAPVENEKQDVRDDTLAESATAEAPHVPPPSPEAVPEKPADDAKTAAAPVPEEKPVTEAPSPEPGEPDGVEQRPGEAQLVKTAPEDIAGPQEKTDSESPEGNEEAIGEDETPAAPDAQAAVEPESQPRQIEVSETEDGPSRVKPSQREDSPPEPPAATPDESRADDVSPEEPRFVEDETPPSEPEPDEAGESETAEAVTLNHKVRRGETLGGLAVLYGVRATDIKNWNNLRSFRINYGTTLKILVPPQKADQIRSRREGGDDGELKGIEHTVLNGESLTSISNKYGVALRDLVLWNRLSDARLQPGQLLRLFVDAKAVPQPATRPPETPTESETAAAEAEPVSAEGEPEPSVAQAEASALESKPAPAEIATIRYRVRRGDTLNKIARRFGTTRNALLKLNRIADPNHIFVGQRLRVPEKR